MGRLWLVLALTLPALGDPIIPQIESAVLETPPSVWGSKWMGDSTGKERVTVPQAQQPLYTNQPPLYFSKNDPGLDAYDFTTETTKFMKHFGVGDMAWRHEIPLTAEDITLQRWAEENGVSAPCATIARFSHPQFTNTTIRGLASNCTVQAHKEVLQIPTKVIITTHRLAGSPTYDRIHQMLQYDRALAFDIDHVMLSLFLCIEKQDQSSFFAPYLASLPPTVGVPAESDAYGHLWLDASHMTDAIQRRAEAMEWQFTHLTAFFENHPQLLPKYRHFNRDMFSWAYNTVTARAFRLDFGVHKDTLCLVPFADLMNHGFTEVGWLFRGKMAMGLYSSHEIPLGSQILSSYGRLGNEALLQDFGFVLHDNPYTCAHVRLPDPNPNDPKLTARSGLLATRNLEFQTPICVLFGAPSRDLLFAALCRTLDGDRLTPTLSPETIFRHVTGEELDRALEMLERALTDRIAEYHYAQEQDERLLPLLQATVNSARGGDQLTQARFNSVFLRWQEKIILRSTLEFINTTLSYRCTALPPSYEGSQDDVFEVRASKTCAHYSKHSLIPLLLDLAWENGPQLGPVRQHRGPWEDWDFRQDHRIFPKEGQPKPLCSPDGNCEYNEEDRG